MKYLMIHVLICGYKILTVGICNLCLCVEIVLFILDLYTDVCNAHCSLRLLLIPALQSQDIVQINKTEQTFINLKEAIPLCMVKYLIYQCRHYTTYKIKCIVTSGYIWLHVSAVALPSSGQQGTVLLRYIQLAFPVGTHWENQLNVP